MNQGLQPKNDRARYESVTLTIPTSGTVEFYAPVVPRSVVVVLVCLVADADHGYQPGDEVPIDLAHARNAAASSQGFLSWYLRDRKVTVTRNAGNWQLWAADGSGFVTGVAAAPGASQFLTSNFGIKVRCL